MRLFTWNRKGWSPEGRERNCGWGARRTKARITSMHLFTTFMLGILHKGRFLMFGKGLINELCLGGVVDASELYRAFGCVVFQALTPRRLLSSATQLDGSRLRSLGLR